MRAVRIITFGFGHPEPPPAAHITLDLRPFSDPHRIDKRLQQMTAHDGEIREIVRTTPGVQELIDATLAQVDAYLASAATGPVVMASGCTGGKHRGPAVGMELAEALVRRGITVTVTHRDINKPVIAR